MAEEKAEHQQQLLEDTGIDVPLEQAMVEELP